MNKKMTVLGFIKKHKICVISTVNSKGNPESGVIEFGETDNLELIFDTFFTYRKYNNIQNNPYVSIVVGWDEDITIQYEGKAYELKDNELSKYKKIFFKKLPNAKKWQKYKEIRFFKVIPKWIRYSDLRVNPWNVFDIKF